MAKKKLTHGVQVLVVAGSGEFPLDMLRYDSCCPNEERDSNAIANHQPRAVVLRRFAQESVGPTERRWSFGGWRVFWWGDPEVFSAERDRIMGPVEKLVAEKLAIWSVRGMMVP